MGVFGGVMNVGLNHGAVDPKLATILEFQVDRGLQHEFIDGLQRLESQAIKGAVEGIVFGYRLAEEMSEASQAVAVGDALAQFAQVPAFGPHQDQGTQNLRRSQPMATGSGFLQTALQIASYLLEERGVQVEEVRDGLQNGMQAEVLLQELQVGKADLRLRGSGHGSTLHVGFFLLSYGI